MTHEFDLRTAKKLIAEYDFSVGLPLKRMVVFESVTMPTALEGDELAEAIMAATPEGAASHLCLCLSVRHFRDPYGREVANAVFRIVAERNESKKGKKR